MEFYNKHMPKPQLNAEQTAFLNSCSMEQLMDQRYVANVISELGADPEVRELERALPFAQFKEQSVGIIRKLLIKAGTDVDQNDRDPYGDGDQSLLLGMELESKRQILRNLFSEGGDIEQHMRGGSTGFTDFSWSCIKGDTKAVERKLKAVSAKGQKSLAQLMEYRETSMRLTPLILTVALSKHKQTVRAYTKREIRDMDHVGVFRTLIRYGARPDAKDVTGKTVCHYGAGVMATDETLEMTKMAVKATPTCAFFGQEVVLSGLNKVEYNEVKGTLGGFVAETERRVMYPEAGSVVAHELSLKPVNIFVETKDDEGVEQQICILESPDGIRTNLIDNRDRLGSISMHEVAMSQREDVAKFLCKHSTTCLDVAEGSGTSIRQMMCTSLPIPSKVMPVLKKHAAKQASRCANCDKTGKLLECSLCFSVAYCSKECQVSHWNSKHKKECKRLRKQSEVVLGGPKTVGSDQEIFSMSSKGHHTMNAYSPPKGLKNAGERFWIKVQSNGIQAALVIYDKSRTCNFMLPPGENGHRELVEKVSEQQTFLGRKSFFKARFDEQGRCVVNVNSSAALKW